MKNLVHGLKQALGTMSRILPIVAAILLASVLLSIGGLPAQTVVAIGDHEPFDTQVGSYNNVIAYSNGDPYFYDPTNLSYVDSYCTGVKWQCVEYVNRYYYIVYDMEIQGGNAKDYYGAGKRGLVAYRNGGTEPPMPGDILCAQDGPSGLGHVAIVRSVSADSVHVIEQNYNENANDNDTTISMTTTNGHYTIASFGSGLTMQGWLRPANTAMVTDIPNPDAYASSQPGYGYVDFEAFPEGTNLSSGTIAGMHFTTTNGYSWLVGDFATGNYNGKYPNGAYTSHGSHWAWLGINQGSGRIDFPQGTASYISLLVSDLNPVSLEAYGASGNLLATAGPSPSNTNTGHMTELKITRAMADISYVMVHDTGNYFEIDDVCTNAPGTPNTINGVVDETYFMQTGQHVFGNFIIDAIAGARQLLHIFLGPFFSDVDLELTRPDGSVVSPSDPGVTYDKTPNSIEVTIDDALPGQWGYEIIANQLEAGGENIHIVAHQETILIPGPAPDTAPPPAPDLLSPSMGTVSNDNAVVLEWSDVTDPSTPVLYQVQVDNNNDFSSPEYDSGWISLSNATTSALSDDTYYWRARSEDSVGNVGDWSAVWQFLVDTTPPSVAMVDPPGGGVLQDGVTFEASAIDNGSGVNWVTLSIREDDGGAGIPVGFEDLAATCDSGTGHWTLLFDTLQLQDGYYVVLVKAADNAGNIGSITVPYSIKNWVALTTNVVGQGSVSRDPDQTIYMHGTEVTLTAEAACGWAFVGWSGDLSGNTNPVVVTVDGDKVIMATFAVKTKTLVFSSANPSVYGQRVTFVALVLPSAQGSGMPTGTVTFKDAGVTLGTGTLNSCGWATFSTSSLSVGKHSITAVYAGDANFNCSTSSALAQKVNKAKTTVKVISSANPSISGKLVTFTATVLAKEPGAGVPTGTVTFKDGCRTLGTSMLDATGHATYSTSSLCVGGHSVTAVYGGDDNFCCSASSVVSQKVKKR